MTTTSDGKGIYRAFLACLFVVSLPIKNFAYVAPALYLLILLLNREYRVVGRVILLSSAILLMSGVAVLWDHLAGRTVNFPGLWLGLITHAPLFIVLCESFDREVDQQTYQKFVTACICFIVLQSLIGVFQFVATGNPDAVCGTFGLLDGFKQQVTIAQVYFTFTIFGMILFLIPAGGQPLAQVAIVMGMLICVLAQSGHQMIFFVASLVACGLLRITRIGTLARTICAATLIAVLVLQFYPNTAWLACEWFDKVAKNSDSPKRMALEGASSIMTEPKNFLIGTGLGQYSSRAALISSNEYLSVKLPQFMIGHSEYYDEHIRPAGVLFEEIGEGSAIAKPYMSALSIPVELGLVACFALFFFLSKRVLWCVKVMWGDAEQSGWIGFTTMVGILFFLCCCLIENYAEFTQAVFAPFILYVVAGSRAETMLGAASDSRRDEPILLSERWRAQRAMTLRTIPPRHDL
jgi:hypothetical protein